VLLSEYIRDLEQILAVNGDVPVIHVDGMEASPPAFDDDQEPAACVLDFYD